MRKNKLYYQRRLLYIMKWTVDMLMAMDGIALLLAIVNGYANPQVYARAIFIYTLAALFDCFWCAERSRLYKGKSRGLD